MLGLLFVCLLACFMDIMSNSTPPFPRFSFLLFSFSLPNLSPQPLPKKRTIQVPKIHRSTHTHTYTEEPTPPSSQRTMCTLTVTHYTSCRCLTTRYTRCADLEADRQPHSCPMLGTVHELVVGRCCDGTWGEGRGG